MIIEQNVFFETTLHFYKVQLFLVFFFISRLGQSRVLFSSLGRSRIKSRTKSHGTETDNRGKNLDDFIPKSRSSTSQNTSSRSRALSSSDGRSTTCSGENFDPVISTKSESSDESRTGETLDSLSQTSPTAAAINETLRWDFVRSNDPDEEEERLRIYKLHRRKRYLEFLQRTNGREAESGFYA